MEQKSRPRVFCIGMNKSGTTSISNCMSILGIDPIVTPSSSVQELKHATDQIFNYCDYEPALRIAGDYRGFKDRPWNVWEAYKHLDRRFPDSLFILTVRDVESWWRSANLWVSGENSYRKKTYLKHLRVETWQKTEVIEAYNRHNDAIRRYFEGSGRLLVCDLESGDGWEPICGFLDAPIPQVGFPHVNRQSHKVEQSNWFAELLKKGAGFMAGSK